MHGGERGIHLPIDGSTLAGVVHEPEGPASGTAVLVCAPFGWDDVASYRARRAWANRLAAAGHRVLRFDAPGSGDSTGGPGDPDLLEAWVASVDALARLLRSAGSESVTALGLGLGGLVALEAAAAGAPLDDVVLWGTPPTGRAAVRELRAAALLQADRLPAGQDALPEGWLEAGGHVLSRATADALRACDPAGSASAAGPARALVLARPGVAGDPKLARALAARGVGVDEAPGPGWGALVEHPQRAALDPEVLRAVADRLRTPARAPSGAVAVALPRPAPLPSAPALRTPDGAVAEEHWRVATGTGDAVGVLARPTDGPEGPLAAVFLNAGAVRRIGPNRLWTEVGRGWAARGVPTLRVDLPGVGDAGEAEGPVPTPALYTPERLAAAGAVVRAVLARPGIERVVLVGLCAGGHLAFRLAASEPGIATAVVVNATALHWPWHDPALDAPPGPRALLHPTTVHPGTLRELRRWAGSALRREAAFLRTRRALERELDAAQELGARIVLALNPREPEQLRLELPRSRKRLGRWPGVRLARLTGTDHTLRPVAAQRELRALLDAELALACTPAPRT